MCKQKLNKQSDDSDQYLWNPQPTNTLQYRPKQGGDNDLQHCKLFQVL